MSEIHTLDMKRPVSVTILSSTYLSNLLIKLLLTHSNSTAQTPQYTTLRVPVIDQQLDYLSVTLIGENLICGSNLHVIPLTALQTDRWTGIWHTCQLITELTRSFGKMHVYLSLSRWLYSYSDM